MATLAEITALLDQKLKPVLDSVNLLQNLVASLKRESPSQLHEKKEKMNSCFTCSRFSLLAINVFYMMTSFLMIAAAVHGNMVGSITSIPIVGSITACGIFLLLISIIGIIAAILHHQLLLFFYLIVLLILFLLQVSVSSSALVISSSDQSQMISRGWGAAFTADPASGAIHDAQKLLGCCGLEGNYSMAVRCATIPACTSKNGTMDTLWQCPTCEYSTDTKEGRATTDTQEVRATTDIEEIRATTDTQEVRATTDIEEIRATTDIEEVRATTDIEEIRATTDIEEVRDMQWSCPTCQDILERNVNAVFKGAGAVGLVFAVTEFCGIIVAYKVRNQYLQTSPFY